MPKEAMVLLWIAIIGVIAWVLIAFVPLPYPFPTLIIAVAIIMAILFAWRTLGGSSSTF